jgi:hypothetical protein
MENSEWNWCEHGDHYHRAMAAYFRYCKKENYIPDQPSGSSSGECTVQGREYVRLANVRGLLAVYRIKPDGLLRRLKRWPKELEEDL